jgi:hypothetical protein
LPSLHQKLCDVSEDQVNQKYNEENNDIDETKGKNIAFNPYARPQSGQVDFGPGQ